MHIVAFKAQSQAATGAASNEPPQYSHWRFASADLHLRDFLFRSEESFEERIAEIARDRDDRISPETLCEMCAISGYLCYKNVDSLSLNGQSEAPASLTLTIDTFSFTRSCSCLTRSSRVVSVVTGLIL